MTDNELRIYAQNNLAALPYINRARGSYIYSHGGHVRLIDMHLAGGHALFGHKAGRMVHAMKNSMERGVYAQLPSVWHYKTIALLQNYFSPYKVYVYNSREQVAEILRGQGFVVPLLFWETLADIQINKRNESLQQWRPFYKNMHAQWGVPILPTLGSWLGQIILCHPDIDSSDLHSDVLSPIVLTALRQSIGTMLSLEQSRATHAHPRVKQTKKRWAGFQEQEWQRVKYSHNWQRIGPYLLHNYNHSEYQAIFAHALACGVLLNPYAGMSIISGVLSRGDVACITNVLGE